MNKLICLLPIKNEDWILEKFLNSASIWADKIIIADQHSTDKSKEISSKFSKVIYVRNDSLKFNEPERQKLLIDEARKIAGNKVLIALDADEFLTLDNDSIKELEKIKKLKKSTVIKFDLVNIKLNDGVYWFAPQKFSFGYVDDGSKHKGIKIHSPRIPVPDNANVYYPEHLKVMHYQYADWSRMESKHRWYQCWEAINNPKRNSIDIFRQYHHMYSIKNTDLKTIPEKWYDGYKKEGIDLKNIEKQRTYYWDREVLEYFLEYGTEYFRKISIWDIDWKKIASKNGYKNIERYSDPRNNIQKIIHCYLNKTQKYYPNKILIFIDILIKHLLNF